MFKKVLAWIGRALLAAAVEKVAEKAAEEKGK